jgi:hypothetical protein
MVNGQPVGLDLRPPTSHGQFRMAWRSARLGFLVQSALVIGSP